MSIQLSDFAAAAVEHAWAHHEIRLDPISITSVDSVIDRERNQPNMLDREPLILCYGAWLGELLITHGGQWIGLHEPTPPRILFAGAFYSPMDAIRRRLQSEHAPTVQQLLDQFLHAAKHSLDQQQANAINTVAWNSLSQRSEFVNRSPLAIEASLAIDAIDPWLTQEGPLPGRRILCLAAGGGTHAPLLAMMGAEVTVVDLSPVQLAIDQRIAQERGLKIETIQASMDDLRIIGDGTFDCVVQPVSSSYVRDLRKVYYEVGRILVDGGLYLAQHKQPGSLQAAADFADGYAIRLPHAEGGALMPTNERAPYRETETVEFIHTIETLLGELCRCGFTIEDIQEPPRGDAWAAIGSPEHRACYLPPYIKVKARKKRI
jgi:SAM-dependent methyltransferase